MDTTLFQNIGAAVGGGAALSALLWGLFVQREGMFFQGMGTFIVGVTAFGAVLAWQWFWCVIGF